MPRSTLSPQQILQESYDETNRALRITGSFPSILGHGESTVTVVNTTSETDLFSYTLPGGTLRAGDRLLVRGGIDMLNNSGGNVTYAFKFYVGTTAVISSSAPTFGASQDRRKGMFEFWVVAVSTSAQDASGQVLVSGNTTGTMATIATHYVGAGAGTEDTSSDKVIKLAVTMGTAASTADLRLRSYMVMKVPV